MSRYVPLPGRTPLADLISDSEPSGIAGKGRAHLLANDDLIFELHQQGLKLTYRPSPGETVGLRLICSASLGSKFEDVTGQISDAVMKGAVTAAQLIGLDMAGIDMKLRGRGVNGDDFSIIEVNSSPGLNMHGADNPNISFNLIQTLVNYITT